MSNIPPDPPDPPASHLQSIPQATDGGNPSHRRARSSRGRARGPGGNSPSHRPRVDKQETGPKERKARDKPVISSASSSGDGSTSQPAPPESGAAKDGGEKKAQRGRRKQFGARLTEGAAQTAQPPRRRKSPPPDSDLTTRLTYALKTPPYPDCPICFNPIHPAQPTWSCSLSEGVASCCWTPFHLKCIKEWARKSTKDIRDAFLARGQSNQAEYWRCPGCQTKRPDVPRSYLCFCGAVADPKPGISTPHSCGLACSRKRLTCDHSCPNSCHPGPCPPCVLTIYPTCHCGKDTIATRCSQAHTISDETLSCHKTCERPLSCGSHQCQKECHPGDCGPCSKREVIFCFCGKHTKEVDCGEGLDIRQEAYTVDTEGVLNAWTGRFDCGNSCDRLFECNVHKCSKGCHVPSPTPTKCPSHPSLVQTCPCGKTPLDTILSVPRSKCTDDIPSCNLPCQKGLDGCSHECPNLCHAGPCPPCAVRITVPCRCGLATREVECHKRQSQIGKGEEVFLCDRPCGGLRLCGRHQCSRICCPLASLARSKAKGKKAKTGFQHSLQETELDVSERMWHECDLVCGKQLSCSLHQCEQPDHRGPCPPCLRSSFEELVCNCGRTIIEPPVPCGTKIICSHPCSRPPPSCGHARTAHNCHGDDVQCPPCPFLTTKPCACGKSNVNNVRCSQEKVSCGQACGKLSDCGFHRCQRSCHGDECGTCVSTCDKPRKLCLPAHHPCLHQCHAPSACNEDQPCEAAITISCPCGRYQQPIKCGRSTANPTKAPQPLQCRDECAIAKRNARLAEALGISPDRKEKPFDIVYSEELVSFAKENSKFLALVESTLNEFVSSDKKTQILPYMPETRRKFVRELCHLYRLDTQLVDPEPRRSIQIFRRIDTRVPTPLLSAHVASSSSTLGKLADLRSTTSSVRPNPPSVRPSASTSSGRGWTSVVSQPQPVGPSSSVSNIPWTGGSGSALPSRTTSVTLLGNSRSTSPARGADVPNSWDD